MKRLLAAATLLLLTGCITNNAAQPPTTLKGWGTITDPDHDCDIRPYGPRVAITVPETAHDFAAELGRFNAPRILSPVRGDFITQVKVSGHFHPVSDDSTIDGRKPYNGAGLLVVADEQNHLSLQLGAFPTRHDQTRYYLNFEIRHDGKKILSRYSMDLTDRDALLRLERRGHRFTAAVSQDAGRTWRSYDPATVDFPDQLQVGIEAVNSSLAEFRCTFTDLVTFRTRIDSAR